jgi:hypothetical protein
MDGETSHEPDSARTAPDLADSAKPVMQTFLFAMPGALDLIVCDEAATQEAKAA